MPRGVKLEMRTDRVKMKVQWYMNNSISLTRHSVIDRGMTICFCDTTSW